MYVKLDLENYLNLNVLFCKLEKSTLFCQIEENFRKLIFRRYWHKSFLCLLVETESQDGITYSEDFASYMYLLEYLHIN